jgi:signal transduction histidine kinase
MLPIWMPSAVVGLSLFINLFAHPGRWKENMPALKRLRKSQEQVAIKEEDSRAAFVLNRILDEVALPLDESALLCQRVLDGAGSKLSLEQRKWIETVSGGATRSAQRLRDYVDLMLLEAGDIVLQPKPHGLDEVIEQVARNLRPVARAKGLHLVVEPAVQPLPLVLADPSRVAQVLTNLIGNAIKFSDRGQVTVSTEPYDRSIAVHIVDTGIGIPTAVLPKLYEDFYQGEGAKERDPFSCGLGLTLSRRMVIRLGGDVWASSTVSVGSKFSFTVPRAPNPPAPSKLAPV